MTNTNGFITHQERLRILTDANGDERKGISLESDWDGRILSIPGWWCRMEAEAFSKGKFRSATIRDLMLAGF